MQQHHERSVNTTDQLWFGFGLIRIRPLRSVLRPVLIAALAIAFNMVSAAIRTGL